MPEKLPAGTNLLLAILLVALPCTATVAAGPDAPTDDRYDPSKQDPRTDPNSPQFDKNYNPATDPDHPLKDPGKDPAAGWAKHRRADGTPQVATGKADWDWGEMYFDGTYATALLITNDCDSDEKVTLFINNLPYLEMKKKVTVPAKSMLTVKGTITTPPEPAPPFVALGQPPPAWGWVKPPDIPPQPYPPPPPQWHQPNFAKIDGNVVAWHPWTGNCQPKRTVYKAGGHIHFRPPDPGPSNIAKPDVCEVYWLIGERPAQLDLEDSDCTRKIRELALHFLQKILDYHIRNAPDMWSWLPGPGRISEMTIDQLLAMKARADGLMGLK